MQCSDKMNVKNLFLFLRSKLFWWNILAIFASCIVIIIGTLLFLNSYTDHGESEIVPVIVQDACNWFIVIIKALAALSEIEITRRPDCK